MEHSFWHERWQQGQIGFHRAAQHPALERWWPTLALPLAARVFVPLCGKSRDLAWLAELGHEVVGCELSPIAAAAFFAESGTTPQRSTAGRFERWCGGGVTILVGDYFELLPADLGEVAAFYDRGAFVAMPPAVRPRYAAQLAALAPPGAAGLLLTLDYPAGAMEGPPFSIEADEVQSLLGPHFALELLQRQIAGDPPPRLRGTLHESAYRLARRP